jgi:hypothetical protein
MYLSTVGNLGLGSFGFNVKCGSWNRLPVSNGQMAKSVVIAIKRRTTRDREDASIDRDINVKREVPRRLQSKKEEHE